MIEQPAFSFDKEQSSYLSRVLNRLDSSINNLIRSDKLSNNFASNIVGVAGINKVSADGSYFTMAPGGFNITGFADTETSNARNRIGRVIYVKFTGVGTLVNSATFVMLAGANLAVVNGKIVGFISIGKDSWQQIL